MSQLTTSSHTGEKTLLMTSVTSMRNIEVAKCPDSKNVYVDHAGAALYSRSQLESQQKDLLKNLYGNPHSRSQSSQITTDTIDQLRFRILKFFQTTPEEYTVVFTSGCTEALKLLGETFTYSGSLCTEDQTLTRPGHATGCFCYLLDNHTSVQGMREFAIKKGAVVMCLTEEELNTKDLSDECMLTDQEYLAGGNCLFAFPAQSNFSGRKYPLLWVGKAKRGQFSFQDILPGGNWFTVLDAASFVSTSRLNLESTKPDFIGISFYKIFGFPTGLGALLVHNKSAFALKKTYFGGGTVAVSAPRKNFYQHHSSLPDSFEDGTVSFLDIISLQHGFDALETLAGGMEKISLHCFSVARFFYDQLSILHHGNGALLASVYCSNDFTDINVQGPVVTFNLIRANGNYIGYSEVAKLAQLYNIHLRTGCFCNMGACQIYLGLSTEQIIKNYQTGHTCGDDVDLIDGKPTGSVRISFGYSSTRRDAQLCLQFLSEYFLEDIEHKPIFVVNSLTEAKASLVSTSTTNSMPTVKSGKFPSPAVDSQALSSMLLMTTTKDQTSTHQTDLQTLPEFKAISPLMLPVSTITRVLTNIYLYPIKSCRAFEVKEWSLGPAGFLYDRQWMIVSERGVCLNQIRAPALCMIQPKIDLEQQLLVLSFPEMPSFSVPLQQPLHDDDVDIPLCTSKVCGDKVCGVDCGEDVAEWLNCALKRQGCRLFQLAGCHKRMKSSASSIKNDTAASAASLVNKAQFLVLSRPSVKELFQQLVQKRQGKQPSQMDNHESTEILDLNSLLNRFRSNLVVDGGEPFDEEKWKEIQIGDKTFVSQGPCDRCQMICIDQSTSRRSKEPFATLSIWRGNQVKFGIYLQYKPKGSNNKTIRVGDEVISQTI